MDKEAIMTRIGQHLDYVKSLGYNPIYIALYGSQNYELDIEESDIDTKAIVLPSLEEIVLNKKPISAEIVLPNDEHCDIKDIRLMFGNYKKQNVNFLETLFTDFYIIDDAAADEIKELRALNERIAHYNQKAAVKTMVGMAEQKYHAMEHDYPSKVEILEKYGYDPKQVHHIVRLREFLERYINGESFKDCLISKHKAHLLRIKKGEFSLLDARQIAQAERTKIKTISNIFLEKEIEIDNEVEEKMNDIMVRLFKKKLNIV